jgi:hypothetical protein
MSAYETRIKSVVSSKRSLLIRFTHPGDRRVPPLFGYGSGADWVKPADLRAIETALVEAANATGIDDLEGRRVTVSCDSDGVVEGLAFEDASTYTVVWFPDFCKP